MLSMRSTQLAIVLVTLASICSAFFRVATAPDRVRDRREMAHKTCVDTGGDWAVVDNAEVCRKAEALWPPGQ